MRFSSCWAFSATCCQSEEWVHELQRFIYAHTSELGLWDADWVSGRWTGMALFSVACTGEFGGSAALQAPRPLCCSDLMRILIQRGI